MSIPVPLDATFIITNLYLSHSRLDTPKSIYLNPIRACSNPYFTGSYDSAYGASLPVENS